MNVTELTDADTAGMNALLIGIATELNINNVLVVQVSDHARKVVEETDLARKIMYAAKQDNSLPVGYDSGLLSLHEKKPFSSVNELNFSTNPYLLLSHHIQYFQHHLYIHLIPVLQFFSSSKDNLFQTLIVSS